MFPSEAKINALENQGQENLKAQSKTLKWSNHEGDYFLKKDFER